MLNPFNVLLSAALQRVLNSGTDEETPTARRFRYLLVLSGLYLVATVVIAGSLSFLTYRGYTLYQATHPEPKVINRRGQLTASMIESLELQVIPSANDTTEIPSEGNGLAVVADVQGVLHFRVFDADGQIIVDTDETQLPSQGERLASLKSSLAASRANPQGSPIDNQSVLRTVAAIVGDMPVPSPAITPEQQRVQSHQQALSLLASETGFTVMAIEKFFKSPEDLAKLDAVKDLSEQFDLDLQEERYLLTLLTTTNNRIEMLNISVATHEYLMAKVKAFEARIDGDVERGGPFAEQEVRDQWARLVAAEGGPRVPNVDTSPIKQAITYRKPIRRLDIVKLIVLLRATNQAIRDTEAAHGPLKEFIASLPEGLRVATFTEAATTEHQRIRQGFEQGMVNYDPSGEVAAARRAAMQSENADQLRRFADNPVLVYNLMRGVGDEYGSRLPDDPSVVAKEMAAGKYGDVGTTRIGGAADTGDPELARLWAYSHHGIFAPFALNGLGVEKVMAEHETSARVLERFLGVQNDSPTRPSELDGRQDTQQTGGRLDPEAVAALLPIRAPALGMSASSEKFQEAQSRLRVLEAEHWIPAVRDASAKVLGSDRASLRLEGLAGTWVFSEGKLYFGEGAAPLTIVDRELLRSLAPPPVEDYPSQYLGINRKVFTFPEVLPSRWILVLQDTKSLGSISVQGLERLEREWPNDPTSAEQITNSSGFVFLGPGPKTIGNYTPSARNDILSNFARLDAKCAEELHFQWQRYWGRPFTLPGFDGQWRFNERGILLHPDPIVITEPPIVNAVFLPYGEGERARLPGMAGTWEVHKDRLVLMP